jgi:hypothetical protein
MMAQSCTWVEDMRKKDEHDRVGCVPLLPIVAVAVRHIYSEIKLGGYGRVVGTYLNSLRRAFEASLAFASVADARSQTSRTAAQSSDEVAVK